MRKMTGFSRKYGLSLDGFKKNVRILNPCAPFEGSLAALFGKQEAVRT